MPDTDILDNVVLWKPCLRGVNIAAVDEGAPDDPGSLDGHGNIFWRLDDYNELCVPGCWEKNGRLQRFVDEGFLGYGHDWKGLGVGTIDEAKEDKVGLWSKATFLSTIEAQQARRAALERKARGKMVSLSVGFWPLSARYVDEDELMALWDGADYSPSVEEQKNAKWGALLLTENELVEYSLVGAAACRGSQADNVKGLHAGPFERQLRSALAAVDGIRERARSIHNTRQDESAGRRSVSPRSVKHLKETFHALEELMDVLGVVREEATESEDTTGTGTGTETPPAEPANDKGADDPPAISAATEEQLREATARAEATLAMTQRLLADA